MRNEEGTSNHFWSGCEDQLRWITRSLGCLCKQFGTFFFIPPLFHWKSWWVDGVPLVCVFFYPVSTGDSKFWEMIKNSVPLVCRCNLLKHCVMHRKTNVYRTCSIILHTRRSTCTKYNFIKQLQEKKSLIPKLNRVYRYRSSSRIFSRRVEGGTTLGAAE